MTRTELEEQLRGMTVKEIRAFAKEQGVCLGYDAANKESMVSRIGSQMKYEGKVTG